MGRWSLAAILLGLVGGTARAEETPAVRHGLVFGGAVGGGAISASCNGCDTHAALGLDLHVGGMLSPQLALLFDLSGGANYSTALVQTRYVISVLYAGAAQLWMTPELWMKGGFGLARGVQSDAPIFQAFATATGIGFQAAAGCEFVHRGTFAMDLQLAARAAVYSGTLVDDVGLLLGLNWY